MNLMIHKGAGLLLSLLLGGCTTLPGASTAPPATLPPQWQAALPAGDSSTELADWWRRFDDPLLPPLISAAQDASPTLGGAAARVAQARATRAAAGAALLPALNAVGSASQGRGQPGLPVSGNASLGLQAGWEIDLFGGGAAGRDAAQARLDGARAAWHDAHIAVAAEVATSYVALRGCEAQLVQTRLDADSRAQTTRLTELSARSGFAAPADAALARASAAQARNQAVAQRAACDTQLKSLVELTDIAEPELRQRLAARTAQVPLAQALSVKAVPAELLTQRPDLAEAARRVLAAVGDQAQASAREKPQISLSGSIAGASVRSGGETTSGATWSFGPLQVSFPLFDGGARRAASASARAAYDEAVAAYRGQVRRAVREVESSLVSLQASAEREADARLAALDFEASLRATEARQKGGLASLFDLEAARRNAVAAQSALIELQRERTAAWISLYRALGGGWSETLLADSSKP